MTPLEIRDQIARLPERPWHEPMPECPVCFEMTDGGVALYWGQPFGGVVVAVTVKAAGGYALGRVSAPGIVSGRHYKRRDALIRELRWALRELERTA